MIIFHLKIQWQIFYRPCPIPIFGKPETSFLLLGLSKWISWKPKFSKTSSMWARIIDPWKWFIGLLHKLFAPENLSKILIKIFYLFHRVLKW